MVVADGVTLTHLGVRWKELGGVLLFSGRVIIGPRAD